MIVLAIFIIIIFLPNNLSFFMMLNKITIIFISYWLFSQPSVVTI